MCLTALVYSRAISIDNRKKYCGKPKIAFPIKGGTI
jgi:hypothetical protein